MKILLTRKEHQCKFEHCCFPFNIIKKGSIAVTQTIKRGDDFLVLHFHPECFTQSVILYVNTKVKLLEEKKEERLRRTITKGKVGRPPKTNDLLKHRNLKALLWYHKKVGNKPRVQEIETMIEAMEQAFDK